MHDKNRQARVVALSLAQCSAMVELLRRNDQILHAENVETAIQVTIDLLADEIGQSALADALEWVSEELGSSTEIEPPRGTIH